MWYSKVHLIKPVLGEWKSCTRLERFKEVILCSPRIGHTHITHTFLLTKQVKPLGDVLVYTPYFVSYIRETGVFEN